MNNLTQAEAEKIHTIILSSKDAKLIATYEQTLKAQAEMRMGMYGQTMEWRGIALPEDVKQMLAAQFDIKHLHSRNLVSYDGAHIELRVLAGALPDNIVIVGEYFKFDPQARAQAAGIDFDQFKRDLKAAFKGTVGRAGQANFGILLEEEDQNKFVEYSTVLGLGMMRHPYDKATVDQLMARGNLDDYFQIAVHQGQQVHDKGLSAEKIFLITPEQSRIAVQVMAQILNFQGAEYYLPKEQKK